MRRRPLPAARRALALCIGAAILVCSPASAGVDQVKLRLPLKPKLPLRGNERIALAPFILVTDADKARDKRLANVDLQGEFHRFLKKQLEKKTKFEVVETPADVKLPTQNLTELAKAQEFWASVGRHDRRPRSSCRAASSSRSRTARATRPRSTSPPSTDGPTTARSTSSRPVFSSTSSSWCSTAAPARSCCRTSSRTSARPASRSADELQGLFENLFSLENQILNTFVARDREAERYIFTD